jgi:hypothetical protein
MLHEGQQQQAHAEKDGEDEAQSAVFFDARIAHDAQYQNHAYPAGDGRAQHENQRGLAARKHESQDDSRQRGMGYGIAHQALFSQQGKAA